MRELTLFEQLVDSENNYAISKWSEAIGNVVEINRKEKEGAARHIGMYNIIGKRNEAGQSIYLIKEEPSDNMCFANGKEHCALYYYKELPDLSSLFENDYFQKLFYKVVIEENGFDSEMIDFDFNKDSTSLIINLSDFLPWVAREKTEKHVERHDTETIEFGDF